jgi:hypothetical protein
MSLNDRYAIAAQELSNKVAHLLPLLLYLLFALHVVVVESHCAMCLYAVAAVVLCSVSCCCCWSGDATLWVVKCLQDAVRRSILDGCRSKLEVTSGSCGAQSNLEQHHMKKKKKKWSHHLQLLVN